jgi:hypothetical protein
VEALLTKDQLARWRAIQAKTIQEALEAKKAKEEEAAVK